MYGSPRNDIEGVSHARLRINNCQVSIDSDGYIAGIQITLSHSDNFNIELTSDALISNYKTKKYDLPKIHFKLKN